MRTYHVFDDGGLVLNGESILDGASTFTTKQAARRRLKVWGDLYRGEGVRVSGSLAAGYAFAGIPVDGAPSNEVVRFWVAPCGDAACEECERWSWDH